MPVKTDREYRTMMPLEVRKTDKEEEKSYIVEGYASTFEPYVMAIDADNNNYYERIESSAFENADMSDVIMQYDHSGRVFARQSNGTLKLEVDSHGLKVTADLSRTEGSRALYEDIRSGMIKDMSFAFTVNEDEYDKKSRTRVIKSIIRIFDVSAVSIPANPGTEISARDYFNGVIEMERAERLAEQRRNAAIAKFKELEAKRK